MTKRRFGRCLAAMAIAALAAACVESRPGEAELPADARVTHKAVFIGKRLHTTEGTISLYQSRDYPVIVFERNFRFQGAPDPVVALGKNGYEADTLLGGLLRNSGRQAYAIPGHLSIGQFNEVWLWDRRDGAPLGLARLVPI